MKMKLRLQSAIVLMAAMSVPCIASTVPKGQVASQPSSQPTSRPWADAPLTAQARQRMVAEQAALDKALKEKKSLATRPLDQSLSNTVMYLARCRLCYRYDQKKTAHSRFLSACSALNAMRIPKAQSLDQYPDVRAEFINTVYLTRNEYVNVIPAPKDTSFLKECVLALASKPYEEWKQQYKGSEVQAEPRQASSGAGQRATAKQKAEYISVVTGEYKQQKITSLAVSGDETNLLLVTAKPAEYVEKPLITCGSIAISDYYNYKYDKARPTHYSFDFIELNGKVESGERTNLYLARREGDDIVTSITNGGTKRVFTRCKVVILADRMDLDGVLFELLDWQFYKDGQWTVWHSQVADKGRQTTDHQGDPKVTRPQPRPPTRSRSR